MGIAAGRSMGARRIEELVAWQLAHAFKIEAYRLIRVHPAANNDFAFRDQLRAAASSVGMNIAEGFHRFHRRDFARFLTIALSSLGEAMLWLRDGVDRGHFQAAVVTDALALGERCYAATLRLKQSLTGR